MTPLAWPDGLIGLGNTVGGGEVESAVASDIEPGANDAAEGVVDKKRRGDAGGGTAEDGPAGERQSVCAAVPTVSAE